MTLSPTTEYAALLNALQSRRSIRKFTEAPVARELIWQALEAARWAPSNHNRQGWKFLVYENRAFLRDLGQTVAAALTERIQQMPSTSASYAGPLAHYASFFAEAPVLVVALHKRPASVAAPVLEGLANAVLASGEALSTAMAVQNLLLACHSLGLGACVMTGPLLAPEVIATLDLPPGYEVTCFVALGHPAEIPGAPRRKELDQMVEFRDDPATA